MLSYATKSHVVRLDFVECCDFVSEGLIVCEAKRSRVGTQ